MTRAEVKQKKLTVLRLIKENKQVLFGSLENVGKLDKIEAWSKVLRKAQLLGLASVNRDWSYARDHLFGLWKSRTLAKRDNSYKTGTEKNSKLDIVDNAILDILGTNSRVEDELNTNDNDTKPSILPIITTTKPVRNQMVRKTIHKRFNTSRTTRAIKKISHSDPIELLKVEILESELYKNKLKILKLEKELGIPSSKFTSEFDVDMKSSSLVNNNTENIIMIN